MIAALFLLLLTAQETPAQFGRPADAQTVTRLREILGRDGPPSNVFRDPNAGLRPAAAQQGRVFLIEEDRSSGLRFAPTSVRVTPSNVQTEIIPVDTVTPHEWSKMTVFVKSTGSEGRNINDRVHQMLSTWIRNIKPSPASSSLPFTSSSPVPLDFLPPLSTQFDPQPVPPPTEFMDREDVFTTKAPKMQVADPAMPTAVEGWPLGGEQIEHNPLLEEDDEFAPPSTFIDMLRICPMYPEAATIFVQQMVQRDYSAAFETRVHCRCADGSHESFYARRSKPLLSDQPTSLDPSFMKSDVVVGRFSCAFPGNICIKTENGIRLRSLDWQTHVYPAVGSGGGWVNSYVLLMENGTKLEDADTGKIYLGSSQFDGDRRKSRLEHSYLRIKSISCDGCLHDLKCQR